MAFLGDREVVDRVAAATGLSAGNFPLHEIYWARAQGRSRSWPRAAPVVALIDDIHWAETAFLELLEHVLSHLQRRADPAAGHARHDLLEERPQWGEQAGRVAHRAAAR